MNLVFALTRFAVLGSMVAAGAMTTVSKITPEDSATSTPQATQESTQSSEIEFKAQVEAVNGNLWTIGGKVFTVNSSTLFRGTPAVGSLVEVKGFAQSDGTILAVAIKIEDDLGPSGSDDSMDLDEDDHSGLDDGPDHDLNDDNGNDGVDHQRGRQESGSGKSGSNSGSGKSGSDD